MIATSAGNGSRPNNSGGRVLSAQAVFGCGGFGDNNAGVLDAEMADTEAESLDLLTCVIPTHRTMLNSDKAPDLASSRGKPEATSPGGLNPEIRTPRMVTSKLL